MPSKETVKAYQAAILRLVAEHERIAARREQAISRRSEILAVQDDAVARADRAVELAVVSMAQGLGVDLAAGLLEMEVSEVRRLLRTVRRGPTDVRSR